MFRLLPLQVVAHNTTKVWPLYHAGLILLIIYGNCTGGGSWKNKNRLSELREGEERSGERKEQ